MALTKEEELWVILVHILESDDILYSPDNIARLLINAGFTDLCHIEKVFFNEVFPTFIFHAMFGYHVEFEESDVISALNYRKRHIIFGFIFHSISKAIAFIIPKEPWNKIMRDIKHKIHMHTDAKKYLYNA